MLGGELSLILDLRLVVVLNLGLSLALLSQTWMTHGFSLYRRAGLIRPPGRVGHWMFASLSLGLMVAWVILATAGWPDARSSLIAWAALITPRALIAWAALITPSALITSDALIALNALIEGLGGRDRRRTRGWPCGRILAPEQRKTTLPAAKILAMRAAGVLSPLSGLPIEGDIGHIVQGLGRAGGLSLAAVAFLIPMSLIVVQMLIVIGAPIGISALLLRPFRLLGGQLSPPRRPVRCGDGLVLILLSSVIKGLGARQIAAGEIRAPARLGPRNDAAGVIIDHHQDAVIIAIGVVRPSDQVRII